MTDYLVCMCACVRHGIHADYLVCMCACVRHGIHAHSIIESIPDGIRFGCGLLYSGHGKLKPRAAQRVLNKN